MSQILNKLSSSQQQLLHLIGKQADDFGHPSYIVGGMLRDLFLAYPVYDIDIMLEGDACEFVNYLKSIWQQNLPDFLAPSKVIKFPKYGTAKLLFDAPVVEGVFELDFSSARTEKYLSPAAKPIVKTGTLMEDLARRDFSMNAMAMSISGIDYGNLIDPFYGVEHIRKGLLHLLHEKSFVDDPARMIRGLRFISRFDFSFDEKSHEFFMSALSEGLMQYLPKERLFDEFKKALAESKRCKILENLQNTHVLTEVHPSLRFSSVENALIEQIGREERNTKIDFTDNISFETSLVVFAVLLLHSSVEKYEEILSEFLFSKKQIKSMIKLREELIQYAS